jgi:hypothetical protein
VTLGYNQQIMLVIRAEQMRVLNESFRAAFRQKTAEYLESEYTANYNALGSEGVRNLIDLGIRKAEEHGFEQESEICDLIGVMAEFGADVDKQTWASVILRDRSEPAGVRIGRLTGWAEAYRRAGGNA